MQIAIIQNHERRRIGATEMAATLGVPRETFLLWVKKGWFPAPLQPKKPWLFWHHRQLVEWVTDDERWGPSKLRSGLPLPCIQHGI